MQKIFGIVLVIVFFLMLTQLSLASGDVTSISELVNLTPREAFLEIAIAAMIACALISFLLNGRASERVHVALAMLIVLIGTFCLFTVFGLAGREDSTAGAVVLLGLIALFKLMNQFEIRRKSGRSGS
jgi:hypothetical protein